MNDRPDPYPAQAEDSQSDWPITNCYIDAWTQILRRWDLDPIAGLGVTVTQDYHGDQFTFFKYLPEDLERLYGVLVGELSIWRSLEEHIETQARQGILLLVEVDGYYLPDTRATSYRRQHTKTTIAVESIDAAAPRLTYFHNTGHYELTGEDYAGIFRRLPGQAAVDDVLPPYVEYVQRRWPPLRDDALTATAAGLLRHHLHRRPEQNPIRRYRADFARQIDWLMAHPDRFHDYAFGVFRQLGANFQLLSSHVVWLQRRGAMPARGAAEAAAAISADAKALQFKVARIANRRRFDPCERLFDALEGNCDKVMEALVQGLS